MNSKHNFDSQVVDQTIEKGIKHLLSLTVNGRWKGFPTLAGESDIWVTGFVLAHISKLVEQTNAVNEAQNFLLKSRHPAGGWSYSAPVPPDADSTAWCLMALQSCTGLTSLDQEKARASLWSHFTGKGLSTYTIESGIREFISAPSNEYIAGWTASHPDVSIAAILADLQSEKVPEILSWLISLQTKEGFIQSYWWRGPHYATTLLLRALSRYKHALPEEYAKKTASGLVREQLAGGGFGLGSSTSHDPFTTALALESFTHLSYLGLDRERDMCGNVLLHSQQDHGGWAGDLVLRIPAPYIIDSSEVKNWNGADGGGNSLIEDKDGIFATAMACFALDCWRRSETPDYLLKNRPVFQLVKNGADNDGTAPTINKT